MIKRQRSQREKEDLAPLLPSRWKNRRLGQERRWALKRWRSTTSKLTRITKKRVLKSAQGVGELSCQKDWSFINDHVLKVKGVLAQTRVQVVEEPKREEDLLLQRLTKVLELCLKLISLKLLKEELHLRSQSKDLPASLVTSVGESMEQRPLIFISSSARRSGSRQNHRSPRKTESLAQNPLNHSQHLRTTEKLADRWVKLTRMPSMKKHISFTMRRL